jgi:hypothetical protein
VAPVLGRGRKKRTAAHFSEAAVPGDTQDERIARCSLDLRPYRLLIQGHSAHAVRGCIDSEYPLA